MNEEGRGRRLEVVPIAAAAVVVSLCASLATTELAKLTGWLW